MGRESGPCIGCPYAKEFVSARSSGPDEMDFAITDEGDLMYAKSQDCGIAVGLVSYSRICESDGSYGDAVAQCEAPQTRVVTQARTGLLGKLGMTKTVIALECSAVSREQLAKVVRNNGV